MAKTKQSGKRGTRKQRTSEKPKCFVIMPYGDWFDEYYENVYQKAIRKVGLTPQRADDLYRPSTIINDIWNYTKSSDVILADLTGKNPNVFYELGLAHAIAKPVVLVAQTMEDVPFDLRALRVLLYDKNDPNWGEELQDDLTEALKEVMETPVASVPATFLEVVREREKNKKKLTPEKKALVELRQEMDLLRNELRRQAVRSVNQTAEFEREAARMLNKGASRSYVLRWLLRRDVSEGTAMEIIERAYRRSEQIPEAVPLTKADIAKFEKLLVKRRPSKK